jgi:DNA ligase-4
LQRYSEEFIIETKFDGERIQVHRARPNTFHYFTRNNFDFGPRGYDVLNRLFKRRLAKDRCVLDGELVIWNKTDKNFVPFGYIKVGAMQVECIRPIA